MGGFLELLQKPNVATGAALLVLVAFAAVFASFIRSGRVRRSRDAALRKEQSMRKQFEAILSSARDGVLITSRTSEIVVLTDMAAHMMGVDKSAVLGTPLGMLPF